MTPLSGRLEHAEARSRNAIGVLKHGLKLLERALGLIRGRFGVDMVIRTAWLFLPIGGPFCSCRFTVRALLFGKIFLQNASNMGGRAIPNRIPQDSSHNNTGLSFKAGLNMEKTPHFRLWLL